MTEFAENIQSCPACQAAMDITGLEPLARVECPSCGEPVVVSPYIAHYELIEVVGRGGMGVVYKARDTSLDRFVALKVLRKDHSANAELVAQLETEAAITASINHPYVVRVFTTGSDSGRFYIAMELVNKGTLDDLIGLQGRVAEAQVLEIAVQIAQGLRAAYQHGLIHRDVKPGNILFADAHTAKIVDFGLAMLEAAAAGGGEIWGTPYYVAPEKLDQKPEDFRSDMYSLGATLFHALAGRPPFEAENATMVALKHLKSQAVSLQAFAPHISGSTAYVINRTLLKDPDQRYQSYDELIEHLEYARAELTQKGSQPQAKQRVVLETEEDQKLWSYVTFGMLGVAALLGVGGWWYFRAQPDAPAATSKSSTALAVAGGADAQQSKQYQSARQRLLEGKPSEAAPLFRSLGENDKTPAAMAGWSLVHAGMAELLAGRGDEAREVFTTLESRNRAQDDDLGKFFREIASLMATDKPVELSATSAFPRETYGAIAPLLLGLKDWQLAEFDDAGALLRQYQTASPRGEFSWITDYKDLVADYLSDFTEYRGALELVKMGKTLEDQKQAGERLVAMSKALRTKGKLAERFQQLASEFTGKLDAKQKEVAARAAADKATMDLTMPQIKELSRTWRFNEAKAALSSAKLIGDPARQERRGLIRKLEWLAQWKNTLIADLPRAGAAIKLRKRDGSELKGVLKASDAGVEFQGSGLIPWESLTPESLLVAAEAMIPANTPPSAAASRWWQAGTFAAMSGDSVRAKKLLISAAKTRADYVMALPLLITSARPGEDNVAKGAPVIASGFVNNADAQERPEKAVDGAGNTKWSANEKGPKWLQVDLKEAKTISSWIVHHAGMWGQPSEMNTVDFELQTSMDAKSWETIDRVKGNNASITERIIPPTHARYARLWVTKENSTTDSMARITEFQLRSAKGPGTVDLAKTFFEPANWFITPQLTSYDIKTSVSGGAKINWKSGEVELKGSGNDIWKNDDSFQFSFQKLSGDGEIVTRVLEIENTNADAKTGLMFRESLTNNSKHVFLSVTPSGQVSLQHRTKAGADSTSTALKKQSVPYWLKIVRQGDKFTASTSPDASKWEVHPSVTVQMPREVHVGLAVTSHKQAAICTARYDFLHIAGISSSAPANPPTPGGSSTSAPQPGVNAVSATNLR